MIPRHLETTLLEAARRHPVVWLTGPRQSGKTTLVREAFPGHQYVSLEFPEQRELALSDPKSFLGQFGGKVILAEVQRAPELFLYIQAVVAERPEAGRFILTGSQDFLLPQQVSQTLTSRCARLYLLPFSRAELSRGPITDLAAACSTGILPVSECDEGVSPSCVAGVSPATERDEGVSPASLGVSSSPEQKQKQQQRQDADRMSATHAGGTPASHMGKMPMPHLFETLFAGGYPRIFDKRLDPRDWLRDYCQSYIQKDVRDILNVDDLEAFGRFLRLCAGRCGQLLNLSSLGADAGVTHTTARRWLSVLEASFLVYLLRPHPASFGKRLVKSPKLYFLDSGLLCYLLRIRDAGDLRLHASRGAVFESWVVSEAVKNFVHRGLEPAVYFWRDSADHEIDLVIDRGQEIVPVEARSGETFAADFLDGIKYWRRLTGRQDQPVALVYGGDDSHTIEGAAVMSWKTWG